MPVRRLMRALPAALALAAGLAPAAAGAEPERIERRLGMMGTTLALAVEADERAAALAASEVAVRALAEAEERLSTWSEQSELARLNRAAVGEQVELSPALAAELEAARRCFAATGGAFDPGVGALVEAWGLRRGGRRPSAAEIAAARAAGGFDGLELQTEGGRTVAVRRRDGLRIEEGAFGKGAGLDAALAALARDGRARSALLDLGGQVAVVGAGPWTIDLAHPGERGRPAVAWTIAGGSLSTSGNGERGLTVAGERLGHLLDPRRGAPAPDFGSVTVWAADALTADCLSTGLYVMGPEAALLWALAHPPVEVLVLEPRAAGLRARATPGLRGRLRPLADDVALEFVPVPAAAGEETELQSLARQVEELRRELAALKSQAAADARYAELERRVDLVAAELEKLRLGESVPQADAVERGFGPAASKIYRAGHGLSIGGYGEMLYEGFDSRRDDGAPSGRTDQADLLRAVTYFGYKFNDRLLFNSELEWEHAKTGGGNPGEVAVEFAYLDYLWRPQANLRGGLLLVPMGLVNELHEPTVFLGAKRPGVESSILPSTWRENGFGLFGDVGSFTYRTYVVTGLDASKFSAAGLRNGRQNGARAKAEDLAWVGRLDFTGAPGLLLGGSLYVGDSGQGLAAPGGSLDVGTRIVELHGDWKVRGLELRGLWARADLDQARELNQALRLGGAAAIGEEMSGGYVQAGYDLFARRPRGAQALVPYVRWEAYDTQARVPAGFARNPVNDVETLTFGLAYRPLDQVILKLDYLDLDNAAGSGVDQINFALGYIF